MGQSPLAESLRLIFKQPDRGVFSFYAVLLFVFVLIAGVGFSPALQTMAMRKFHYVPQPFAQWALCQFFPSMYNFHNEVLISKHVLPSDYRGPLTDTVRFAVNHYPLRMFYFVVSRAQIANHASFYIYTRTVYRRQEIVSSYMVTFLRRVIHISLINSYERSGR